MIRLHDTMAREKREFVPQDDKRITMYVCGPTVYNYAHIGNMRPPVVFDVLFRLLRHVYGEAHVIYARNYTDIDDKIIAAAAKSGEPMSAITEKFAKIYEEDTGALGVLIPTLTPRATQNVPGMIAIAFASGFVHYLLDRNVFRMSDPRVRTAARGLLEPGLSGRSMSA